MNRDSKDVWIETEDRVNWSEIENFYDIKEFEPPELVFCKRCKQVFVSYDMFYEHRKAVGMDVRGDEKRLKDGEYIHSLHYGYKLGYENCESKQ